MGTNKHTIDDLTDMVKELENGIKAMDEVRKILPVLKKHIAEQKKQMNKQPIFPQSRSRLDK